MGSKVETEAPEELPEEPLEEPPEEAPDELPEELPDELLEELPEGLLLLSLQADSSTLRPSSTASGFMDKSRIEVSVIANQVQEFRRGRTPATAFLPNESGLAGDARHGEGLSTAANLPDDCYEGMLEK